MPKVIKGIAGRKAPVPSATHSEIDDLCGRLMPDVQPIVRWLDAQICATFPDLDYAVELEEAVLRVIRTWLDH